MVHLDGGRYWLYIGVGGHTSRLLWTRVLPARSQVPITIGFEALHEEYPIEGPAFLIDFRAGFSPCSTDGGTDFGKETRESDQPESVQ